ncbi:MAG: nicotinamide mononucleotide transporter [Lachnospiraceae bacterium]|nr:nicotinamide mononucleotide transporter [Lachnospiraceae bacterium]
MNPTTKSQKNNKKSSYFKKQEIALWSGSVILIFLSFLLFDRSNYMTLIASIIGVTSLIFCAKGNPVGQVLMILFSILYGIISYGFAYYGEMITYLGMTLPMAVFSLISWLRNPYEKNRSEVKVNYITIKESILMCLLTAVVTAVFYFILEYFKTANLVPSTISVATSFAAAYLIFRRSPYFALIYGMNDVVLIVLWVLAATEDVRYISMVVCFISFLVNDLYGYISWKKMEKRQGRAVQEE